jgi:hypothetical protein
LGATIIEQTETPVRSRDVRIGEIDVTVCEIPTDLPESDGTLEWNQTTIVIVELSAGGHRGLGYTYGHKDTTRGRAHLLFEMFHKGVINSGWRSRAVQDSLDLCLSCKGCKQECPANVDLATYKSEFRAHHYRHRLRPRVYYSMGFIGTWGRIGSKTPHLANFFTRMP